jgi:hypothetical protein
VGDGTRTSERSRPTRLCSRGHQREQAFLLPACMRTCGRVGNRGRLLQAQTEGATGRFLSRPQSTQRSGGFTSHGNRFRFAAWNLWFHASRSGTTDAVREEPGSPREPAEAKGLHKLAEEARTGGEETAARARGWDAPVQNNKQVVSDRQNSKQVVNQGSSPIPHPQVCLLKVTCSVSQRRGLPIHVRPLQH